MRDIFGDTKRTYSPDNLVKVPVNQLQPGMFVAELDVPWSETPFLMQGFEIRDRSNILKLESYCDYVYVLKDDGQRKPKSMPKPSRALAPPPKNTKGFMINRSPTRRAPQKSADKKPLMRRRPAYATEVAAEVEHARAREIYDFCKTGTKQLLLAAKKDEVFDIAAARDIVARCIDSILRNPDALIWMTKIKHEKDYLVEHCLNVCILSIVFGRHLRFSSEELHEIGLCGLSHQIGKVKIPAAILAKPGELNEDERRAMQNHPLESHKLLSDASTASKTVIDVALCHRERPDGRGYPRGLTADRIPEYARIIAVVNAYDAMVSKRAYAEAKSPEAVQKIIYDGRGEQFDDNCALAFMQAIGLYPAGTWVELRNGKVAVVLSGKEGFRHLPTVIVVSDDEKNPVDEVVLDLYLTDSGSLDKGYLIQRTLPDGSFGFDLDKLQINE